LWKNNELRQQTSCEQIGIICEEKQRSVNKLHDV